MGTHLDAPTHFYANGLSLDEFPIERFVVQVHTVDCRGLDYISGDHLAQSLPNLAPRSGVFLLTGHHKFWGTEQYFEPFATLSEDGARWLLQHQVGMILVDAPSVDLVDTVDFPNHHRLLKDPVLVVENLAWEDGLPFTFTVAALPLKVAHSNGCPARVMMLD